MVSEEGSRHCQKGDTFLLEEVRHALEKINH